MIYWIRKLQTQLGIEVTGIFDDRTLSTVCHIINPPSPLIRILQEFFNRLGNRQIDVNGKWDSATKEMLTYFQKEYSYKLDMKMPITAKLDENTWKLIAKYCAAHSVVQLADRRSAMN